MSHCLLSPRVHQADGRSGRLHDTGTIDWITGHWGPNAVSGPSPSPEVGGGDGKFQPCHRRVGSPSSQPPPSGRVQKPPMNTAKGSVTVFITREIGEICARNRGEDQIYIYREAQYHGAYSVVHNRCRLLPALSRPPLLPPGALAQPCPRVHAPGPRGGVCGPGQLGGVGIVTGHLVPRCPTHLASHREACLAGAGVVLRLRRGLVPRAVGRGGNMADQPGGERLDSCTSPVRLDHLQVLSAGPWPNLASARPIRPCGGRPVYLGHLPSTYPWG